MTSRSEKKISYGRNILILLLLMAATFAVIFRGDDFPAFLSALKDADGRWLLLGLLCMFLFVGCEAANMHQISHTLGFPLKYFRCGQYAFIGFYFSSITPSASGGQPVQIYYMKKDRISLAHSSFMILYIVMVYQMAMLLLAGLMAALHPALAAETAGHLKYLLSFGLAVNGLAAGLMAMLLISRTAAEKLLRFFINLGCRIRLVKSGEATLQRGLRELADYRKHARIIQKNPRLFLCVLCISMLQMTFLSLVPYCVYRALGFAGYTPGEVITCQSILTLSASAIPTPGAVGAAEVGFLFAFRHIFGPENIKTAMLLSRGISLYLFLIVSFIVCMAVQIRIARHSESEDSK